MFVAMESFLFFFLWLSSILYIYTYYIFILSSIDKSLGCFYNLAILSNAAMNTVMCIVFELVFLADIFILMSSRQAVINPRHARCC